MSYKKSYKPRKRRTPFSKEYIEARREERTRKAEGAEHRLSDKEREG